MTRRPQRPQGKRPPERPSDYEERIADISRVVTVVKGGRRFSFRTVVVVGDLKGIVGVGIGRARSVPDRLKKAGERARQNLKKVPLLGSTIPHEITMEFGGAKVFMKPASPGTGLVAGGGMRAVLECAGVKDVLSKSQGSNNTLNVVNATMVALLTMKRPEDVALLRGKDVSQVSPAWARKRAEQNG